MLVVRGGTHNTQQQLGDGADGNNNSNNTQTNKQTQQRALRTLQDNNNRSLLVSCAGRRTVYRFGGMGEGGVRVWWALSGESVLYSQGRFRGLFNCGAGRRGREDVGDLTGGAVVLDAGALRFCYVLVVLGGAGVLLGRIVCFWGAGVVRWCFCWFVFSSKPITVRGPAVAVPLDPPALTLTVYHNSTRYILTRL